MFTIDFTLLYITASTKLRTLKWTSQFHQIELRNFTQWALYRPRFVTLMKWYMKWIIYELRIWNQVKLWSSQLWTQFSQLRREAWKIQDFNGVWTRSFHTGIARSRVQTPLKSWIFQASLRNCENCVHNCEDHSFTWFHIRSSHMIHFIYHFIIGSLLTGPLEPTNDQLPTSVAS